MKLRKNEWSASQWQAHLTKLDLEKQRQIINSEVPEHMRNRVKRHCITVNKLKAKK